MGRIMYKNEVAVMLKLVPSMRVTILLGNRHIYEATSHLCNGRMV